MTMTAEITFETRDDANEFAKAWSRKTLTGHVITKTTVKVYDVDDSKVDFINSYIEAMSK